MLTRVEAKHLPENPMVSKQDAADGSREEATISLPLPCSGVFQKQTFTAWLGGHNGNNIEHTNVKSSLV